MLVGLAVLMLWEHAPLFLTTFRRRPRGAEETPSILELGLHGWDAPEDQSFMGMLRAPVKRTDVASIEDPRKNPRSKTTLLNARNWLFPQAFILTLTD